MDDATRAYARRVAEAVEKEIASMFGMDSWGHDLDAIIASVPPPGPTVEQQVREAVEREREACALACEAMAFRAGVEIAQLIRARSTQSLARQRR